MRDAMKPESDNPYAPPSTPIEAEVIGSDLADYPDASSGKRFLNYLIDRFTAIGFAMSIFFLLALADAFMGSGRFAEWLQSISTIEDYLLTGIASLSYFVLFEHTCGRTLGKLITGTKVITEHGVKPPFLTILGRTLARFVPFEPFSFLGNNRGWHDRWSGTRVIDIRNSAGKEANSRLSPGLAKIYRGR